jgi:CTP synthase
MQLLTIEFARKVYNDAQITSEEFDEEGKLPNSKYAIHFLPGQHKDKEKGGTLRLGSYPCNLIPGTKTYKLYGNKKLIHERHRHRYEFNNKYRAKLEENGLKVSGIYDAENLVEIVEHSNHPFMIGCQFHPEFLSRPSKPHPLFLGFIQASITHA